MTRKEHITYKVVHEWRADLTAQGYQPAPHLLALHHAEPLLKFVYIHDDEQNLRYIYADYTRGWAWLNDSAQHRLRSYYYEGARAAARRRRAQISNFLP